MCMNDHTSSQTNVIYSKRSQIVRIVLLHFCVRATQMITTEAKYHTAGYVSIGWNGKQGSQSKDEMLDLHWSYSSATR